MALPKITPQTVTVTADYAGETYAFEFHGLTRSEAMTVAKIADDGAGDPRDVELMLLRLTLKVDDDEFATWYAATPSAVVAKLTEAALRLNGLDDAAGEG